MRAGRNHLRKQLPVVPDGISTRYQGSMYESMWNEWALAPIRVVPQKFSFCPREYLEQELFLLVKTKRTMKIYKARFVIF